MFWFLLLHIQKQKLRKNMDPPNNAYQSNVDFKRVPHTKTNAEGHPEDPSDGVWRVI